MVVDSEMRERVEPEGIKRIPAAPEMRETIRRAAVAAAAMADSRQAPTRETLERLGREVLRRLDLPTDYLGFAMVAVDNVYWNAAYRAVPYHRRLLLLPKCLSHSRACAGRYDSVGLHCAACGACVIDSLKPRAEALGYQVIIAEGTTSVLMRVLEGDADAILGVACLDSLEKSFARIADLAIPHAAVPLLGDGCRDTEAEMDVVLALLLAQGAAPEARPQSYLPLLRESVRLFDAESLAKLVGPYQPAASGSEEDPLAATDAFALDWLRQGGERLRPFVTLAAYAAARHGVAALEPDADVAGLLPPAVRCLALAIEVLHKASLVHDDIEDEDLFRYGEPALHRRLGVGPALNVGDFLVGLGYRLLAGQSGELGAECVAAILSRLAAAHLELCRGQGAELLWKSRPGPGPSPRDVLAIYALKTAPAFEVALAAGLLAAGLTVDEKVLRRFCTYVGQGYQVLNDLEDWEEDADNKVTAGQDALSARPTLLRAFSLEAGGAEAAARLAAATEACCPERMVAAVRATYQELGVFDKAERLLERLRARALAQADEVQPEALASLMRFLARVILDRQRPPHR
ncbi:MAG: DUF116 domain-containing protein [Armatimonadetes bacterium]|nr:DUF116 domain-containing protein [Armatimonadota bacterium]